MKIRWSGYALLVLAASAAAEPAKLIRSSELRAKPAIDAPVLAKLDEGATVDLLGTEGGWSQIKTADSKKGFVRMLNVRAAAVGSAGSTSGLGALGGVLRTGSTGATPTTGVKGITKEDLERAVRKPAEVAQLERYAVNANDARAAAKAGKLAANANPKLEEQ